MPDSFVKAPTEVLDYKRDWKYADEKSRATGGAGDGWLDIGETITTSTWSVPVGITQATPAPSHADGLATIWLSGGAADGVYTITNTIVTSAGRTGVRSITVRVENR